MKPLDRNHNPLALQRGSALNELVICMLPYLLVILGALVFWHLLLGKQEAIKYATSNAMPGGAAIDSGTFFGKLDGTPELNAPQTYSFASGAAESSFNDAAQVEDADEPVLPYNQDGSDLKRAIEFSGQQIVYDPSVGKFRLRRGGNSTGSRLENLGFLNAIDPSMTFDSADDIQIDVLQTDLIKQVAQALGEWITYRSASANYTYVAPFGRGALVMENNAPTGQTWRSAEGLSAYPQAPSAFWPVVENAEMRQWSNSAELSSSLGEVFSVKPAALSPAGFTGAATDYDKGAAVTSDSAKQ